MSTTMETQTASLATILILNFDSALPLIFTILSALALTIYFSSDVLFKDHKKSNGFRFLDL